MVRVTRFGSTPDETEHTMQAITFDFGQTLAELDCELLAHRAAERALPVSAEALQTQVATAWSAYGRAKRGGAEGREAWCTFMRTLLGRALDSKHSQAQLEDVVQWLWGEQPHFNLWRKPIPGMFELVEELVAEGHRVGIVSNSEGRLAELVQEMGKADLFLDITDSGRLGIEKPNPAIFEHAARQLGVRISAITHVGDAWEADVRGALRAGCRAIYFSPEPGPEDHPSVVRAFGSEEVRRVLTAP